MATKTTTAAKPKAKAEAKPKAKRENNCACSCGTKTSRTWAPGHDARAKGILRRLETAERNLTAEPKDADAKAALKDAIADAKKLTAWPFMEVKIDSIKRPS